MNIASLILGVISIISCCLGGWMIVGIPCGIVGLILGNKYKEEIEENDSLAKAGEICSKVGLGIAGAWIIGFFLLIIIAAL